MHIRQANPDDVVQLRELYFNTITTINAKDYTPEQITAWAATAYRTGSLLRKVREQYFLVAEWGNHQIIGFASLDDSGCLDMLYVHKDFQGKGVAKNLWLALREKAIASGYLYIETDASITAKPFFEHLGFRSLKEQTVFVNDVGLTNFKMRLSLLGSSEYV
ncbi:MAG: GNAT family N-acetyltransferase [Flavisolibacter sp.]|nr:GNAT family N-acetyltransferase [Flavisolibacter sp.]